ncbi:M20 aminoacylase family protein [Rhodovulum sulfidophilum]|uniref:Amidohydrolase n=1 Tax=Rhodovulum sulfidophilum TaxID=35806 RepID=A0A0D6AWR6_RHOSU|nr:M20 aminoacylase family protein [Rhodovulum sulfidophilum]MBL3561662.1 amidohydrolase [Rhodovulum sulfidophilum]MBL3573322.1 amidohydrolase [Rhodovulum sulfidophilum]MBL3585157.1 amidohydrolase [Rhodovulum sulfidophilum]MCE8430440.1 M20 family metallopeptidase [Rhodovulum sulfidophilum]MCE8440751.1 M20 family metallopeptidase [Rhodovulum sulfidophilum]
MAVENWVAKHIPELVAFRHDMHRNPELLYDLPRTSARVAEALRAAGVDEVHEGIGRTGVVGVIRGQSNVSGRTIGLRSDMDALPIHEETGADWASTVPGKMHACGHDGHMTMLLGAARHLADSRAFDGTVIVIFQPAEEGGAGAKAMIDDGLFARWPCDEVYGMHNRPGLPVGQFTIAPGPIMASVDEIRITVSGRGGHAGRPHLSVDPMPAAAAVIQAVQAITARSVDPIDSATISLCTIQGGNAFNVIPTEVTLTGTVRALREEVRDHIEARLAETVAGVAAGFGATGTLDYIRHYPVTVNHEAQTDLAAAAARVVAGDEAVTTDMPPTLGGEDFSFMLNEVPGALINIGNGPSQGLHHPRYDFDDEAIGWGCSYWTTLVRQRLPL